MTKQNSPKTAAHEAHPLVEHRLRAIKDRDPFKLERSGIIKGAVVFNDSASTTMDSVAESLIMFSEPVIWIVQGNCNVQDIDVYTPLIREKVKAIVAVGQQTDQLLEDIWRGTRFYVSAATWTEALDVAILTSNANDVILFSPGARALEPFANYKERGAYFDKIVSHQNDVKS